MDEIFRQLAVRPSEVPQKSPLAVAAARGD